MILTSLTEYYDRLAGTLDPDTGLPMVPGFGFSEEKIGFVLVLSFDGRVVDVVIHQKSNGKKTVPIKMAVPRPEKRTSGINPNFLWDKSAYVLGAELNPDKNKSKEIPWVKSLGTFEAFRRMHNDLLCESDDTGSIAFLKFLANWNPNNIESLPRGFDLLNSNIVFQLDGDRHYLHERSELKNVWNSRLEQLQKGVERECLVTGKKDLVARLHPSIKGVYGGQSSGGSIVTFNEKAYESYGKSQGDNAPVSELAAFKYTTALNYLLDRENNRCVSVGDTSLVFWADSSNIATENNVTSIFMQYVNPSDDSEATQIRATIDKLGQGYPLEETVPDIDISTRFYLLGLAPNAARLSIRYWHDTTFGELANHLSEHFEDLSFDPLPWNTTPSVWRLLKELTPYREGKKSNSKDIPAHLAGELMRSIITGQRYPYSLLAQLVSRVRSDGHVSPLRAAMMKAVLQRDFRKKLIREYVPMSLEESNSNNAYLLGRALAVLERIQSSAINSANATIVDRYYGAASTVPFSVFPRLIAGSKNHLSKIRKTKPGYAVNLDRDLMGIIGKLPGEFPKHFSIEEQGRFTIGFYHQREHDMNKNRKSKRSTEINSTE